MTDDLVDRLRALDTWVETAHTPIEAADRIEQLERELSISRMAQVVMDNSVEALTAERDVSNELGKALEEDAGQLREALWDILACETPNANATVTRMVAIAKSVLKGETP